MSLLINNAIAAIQLIILFTITTPPANGIKILLICANVNSHILFFSRFADDLARLGHVTELVAPANARPPDFVVANQLHANFTYTQYPVDGDVPFANSPVISDAFVQIALSRSVVEKFQILSKYADRFNSEWEADCVRLLDNEQVMSHIRGERFQFAIVDPMAINCFYVLPYSLGIPYATLSVPTNTCIYRVPRLPSFVSPTLANSDRMSFMERFTTFALDMATLALLVNSSTYYVEKYAAHRPPLSMIELVQHSSAWFIMEDIAVSYAVPHMPNTVSVGDIMAGRPGSPLPDHLESFVADSTDGVIVASFGSYFDFVPRDVTNKLCEAFRRLGESGRRVVWKFTNSAVCSFANERVKIMSWIPQNDLLADRRVRLFITHGGLNSLVEAVYHAKPIIVFPIAVDQPFNAVAAESKGFAIRMDLGDFSADTLIDNVEKMLSDRKYQLSALRSSSILRDRRDTPAERMSYLIEHVIKYGDGHLRTGAFELNIVQFFMIDIFAFLFLVCTLVALVVYCACHRLCRKFIFKKLKTKSD